MTLALCGLALSAAVAGAQTPAGGSESGAAQVDNSSAYAQEAATVPAELAKTLDSKNAKVGEEIVAKTVTETRLADGSNLPKGAKLFGHVTAVQAKTRDHADGQVVVLFDHAIAKDGHSIPLHVTLLGIREPPHAAPPPMSEGDGMGGQSMGGPGMNGPGMGGPGMGSPGAPGTARTGNTASGIPGGGSGGVNSSSPGNMGSPVGPVNMPQGTTSGAGGSTPPIGPAGAVGNLPGVTWANVTASGQLVDPASGAASAVVFNGQGRNVTLDGGTQMVLSVIPQKGNQ